jgi:hypothetical protein
MFPWSDTPGPEATPAYAVGNRVCNSYKPPSYGTVVSVDDENATMGVKWDDGSYPITYPMDATYLKKEERFPWE